MKQYEQNCSHDSKHARSKIPPLLRLASPFTSVINLHVARDAGSSFGTQVSAMSANDIEEERSWNAGSHALNNKN